MNKLEHITHKLPYGSIFLSSWLKQKGISHSLQQRYVSSKKLQKIGHGAFVRINEEPSIWAAINALQSQAKLVFHIAAHSAIILLGKTTTAHFKVHDLCFFGARATILPKWFLNHDWGVHLNYKTTNFLPKNMGLETILFKNFKLKISSHIRGILEIFYSAPNCWDLENCFHSLELARNTNSKILQSLLEHSDSAKANRLFLLFYENISTNKINTDRIKLGKAVYRVYKPGVYEPKYKLTIPFELVEKDFNTGLSKIKTLNV